MTVDTKERAVAGFHLRQGTIQMRGCVCDNYRHTGDKGPLDQFQGAIKVVIAAHGDYRREVFELQENRLGTDVACVNDQIESRKSVRYTRRKMSVCVRYKP